MTASPAAGSAARNQYGTFAVHHPSQKQLAFVKQLIERKGAGLTFATEILDFTNGRLNKKAASRFIDALLALPDATRHVAATGRPATEKQVAFVRDLITKRDAYPGVPVAECLARLDQAVRLGSLTAAGASAIIDRIKSCPARDTRTAAAVGGGEPEAGMYYLADGRTARVYLGQQSGKMLAKVLVGDDEHGFSYEYLGMAARFLAGARPMELAEAKAFGRMTNTCCVCARRLDVPESVDAGIGPKCAKSFR